MGIEPTYSAWKAEVLPLNYTRAVSTPCKLTTSHWYSRSIALTLYMVEGGGFEPPKAEPSDLQSDPFGHSGTPPKISRLFCLRIGTLSIALMQKPRQD